MTKTTVHRWGFNQITCVRNECLLDDETPPGQIAQNKSYQQNHRV